MNTQFGQHLCDIRKRRGFSQRKLAAALGVDWSYISKIENGHMAPPSTPVLLAMAKILEANELIALAGKVPPNLKGVLKDNPLLTELLRVLSEKTLPDSVYQQLLDIAIKADDK